MASLSKICSLIPRQALLQRCHITPSVWCTSSVSSKTPQGPFDDPEPEVNMELTYKRTDTISFDPKNILQEEEEEKQTFNDFVRNFGDLRFGKPAPAYPDREFLASTDPEEWKHVERLLPKSLIPEIPEKDSYPSGFTVPKTKFGEHPYHVSRTVNSMLPVYLAFNRKEMNMRTKVCKVEGNLFQLRDDLDAFLMERYHMQFISQVAEVYSKVIYKGDFEEDFKEFLMLRGF